MAQTFIQKEIASTERKIARIDEIILLKRASDASLKIESETKFLTLSFEKSVADWTREKARLEKKLDRNLRAIRKNTSDLTSIL